MSVLVDCQGVVFDTEPLVQEAQRVLDGLGRGDCELSILLCDDAFIQPLNLSWRGIDAPTDVLSFPQQTFDEPNEMREAEETESAHRVMDEEDGWSLALGDVVISLPTAMRQAATQGHDVHRELRILLVHGICHLVGYDHLNDAERSVMVLRERSLLELLGGGVVGLVDRADEGSL